MPDWVDQDIEADEPFRSKDCKHCDGTGEQFILRRGNAFEMRLPYLARATVKMQCFHCDGTGEGKRRGIEL